MENTGSHRSRSRSRSRSPVGSPVGGRNRSRSPVGSPVGGPTPVGTPVDSPVGTPVGNVGDVKPLTPRKGPNGDHGGDLELYPALLWGEGDSPNKPKPSAESNKRVIVYIKREWAKYKRTADQYTADQEMTGYCEIVLERFLTKAGMEGLLYRLIAADDLGIIYPFVELIPHGTPIPYRDVTEKDWKFYGVKIPFHLEDVNTINISTFQAKRLLDEYRSFLNGYYNSDLDLSLTLEQNEELSQWVDDKKRFRFDKGNVNYISDNVCINDVVLFHPWGLQLAGPRLQNEPIMFFSTCTELQNKAPGIPSSDMIHTGDEVPPSQVEVPPPQWEMRPAQWVKGKFIV
jgi:hypothetical protein